MNSAQPDLEQPNDIYQNIPSHTLDLSSVQSNNLANPAIRRNSANNDYISYDQISEEKSDNDDKAAWKLGDIDST